MMSIARARLGMAQPAGPALLVGINIGLTTFGWVGATSLRASMWGDVLEGCVIVLTISQAILVGLWLAWGDLSALYRWAIVAGSIGIFFLAAKWYLEAAQRGPSDAFIDEGLKIVAFLLAVHAVLLPLRWLGGWRLRFADGLPPPARRGQFTLQHWFVWCVCLVLPLAALSFHHDTHPSDAIGLGVALVFTMPLLAAALPAAFSRRWWLWSLLAVGWTVPVGWTICESRWYYLCSMGMGIAFYRTQLLLLWVAIPAGLASALVANLLLLRAVGMRWVSVAHTRNTTSEPAATPAN